MAKNKASKSETATATDATDIGTLVGGVIQVDPNLVFECKSSVDQGRYDVVDEDKLAQMVVSLKSYGQLTPIQVEEIERDGVKGFLPVFGFTRAEAARRIRNGYSANGKDIKGNEEFTLAVQVVKLTEQDRMLRNVVENTHRNDLSPVDIGQNIKRLIDSGMSQAAVSRAIRLTTSDVSRYNAIMTLPEKVLERVHDGRIAMAVANELAKPVNNLSEDEQITLATDTLKPCSLQSIEDYIRERAASQTASSSETGAAAPTDATDDGVAPPTPAADSIKKSRTKVKILALIAEFMGDEKCKNHSGYNEVAKILSVVVNCANGMPTKKNGNGSDAEVVATLQAIADKLGK